MNQETVPGIRDQPSSTMTTEIVDRITRSFESQSMMKTLGAKIHSIEKGKVVIEAPILPTTLQQQGFGHAGLSFSIGDSAAGYSALTMLEPDLEVMTAEIKMNLLSPADGDFLRAEGRVVKSGKRLIVVTRTGKYYLHDVDGRSDCDFHEDRWGFADHFYAYFPCGHCSTICKRS